MVCRQDKIAVGKGSAASPSPPPPSTHARNQGFRDDRRPWHVGCLGLACLLDWRFAPICLLPQSCPASRRRAWRVSGGSSPAVGPPMELKELPPCSTSPNHAMPCPPANMHPGMVFFFCWEPVTARAEDGRWRFFWLSYRSADPTKHATQSNGFFLSSYSLQSVD